MDWKAEKDKLQAMTLRNRIGYLTTYYRWPALFLTAALLLVLYLGDVVHQSTMTFVLQGFVANDDEQLFDEKLVTTEFSAYLGLGKNEAVVFDDSLYVNLESADHYIEASMAKIYAYMAAKELDFLIAPEFVVDHYLSALPMRDFTSLQDPNNRALFSALEPHLHTSLSFDGVEGLYKLDLQFTRFKGKTPLFMVIPKKSPNPETVLAFLEFARTKE